MDKNIYDENYFIYKGVAYGVGTKVLFTEKVHQKYFFSTKEKNQPHTFFAGFNNGCKRFSWQECEYWKDGEYCNKDIYNPDEEIAEIVEPVYVELVPKYQSVLENIINKKVHPDIFGGCLIYIIVMLVGTIFTARLLIWLGATVIFGIWLFKQYET